MKKQSAGSPNDAPDARASKIPRLNKNSRRNNVSSLRVSSGGNEEIPAADISQRLLPI